MYTPKYFKIWEMVPKDFYTKYQKRGADYLWTILFDERLLRSMDTIREQFGPMKVNDWKAGGNNQYRGIRPPSCKIGADLSQHRFGRAVDLIPHNYSPSEIRADIIQDQMGEPYKFIGGLEMKISWLHIDVRQRNPLNHIWQFNP